MPSDPSQPLHVVSISTFEAREIAAAPIVFKTAAGAGKTTLLDVLSGRRSGRAVAGAICLNGHRVSPAKARAHPAHRDSVLASSKRISFYVYETRESTLGLC